MTYGNSSLTNFINVNAYLKQCHRTLNLVTLFSPLLTGNASESRKTEMQSVNFSLFFIKAYYYYVTPYGNRT